MSRFLKALIAGIGFGLGLALARLLWRFGWMFGLAMLLGGSALFSRLAG